ncbi:hypothetical protein [Pseudofrankia sp. DC12]|nr:hypothetical protein [Pseudofrankia sp. DC12]
MAGFGEHRTLGLEHGENLLPRLVDQPHAPGLLAAFRPRTSGPP